MTERNKRQLRAEAVERLKGMDGWCDGVKSGADYVKALLWDLRVIDEEHVCAALIDLLTDDDSHEERESYEERMYDVPVSDCPYCGCDRVVIHDYNDSYERPHSYRVEHVSEKEAFNVGCFTSYYSFDSVEKAVKHADARDEWRDMGEIAGATDVISAVEFDALDEHAQALERESAELKAKLDQMTVERDILQDCVDDLNADTSELQAKVDELTEQRDRWRSNWTERNIAYSELADEYQELEAKVDELTDQLESAYAKNRALKAHISKMQDGRHGWHIKGKELQARVDELERENAKLSSDELHLRNALASAEFDNATLREKLGRMLDNAHEITRIGGDC